MGRSRQALRQVVVMAVLLVAGVAAAPPVTAQWGWVDSDIPPGAGGSFGAFGGAATSGGAEVFWSGQADDLLAATWIHDAGGWTAGCGAPGGPGACPQGVRIVPGLANGPDGVLLYGGQDAALGDPGSAFGDTWLLTGAGWVQSCATATCGPGERIAVAMAGNGVVALLYGGLGTGPLDDTWVYDGTDWTQVCGGGMAPCGPGPLFGGSMAWDGSRFVLFGGLGFDGPDTVLRDATWTFDFGANEWTQVCGGTDPCGPSPRALSPMASSGGSEIALLGGFDLDGGLAFTDGWRWDGSGWSSIGVPWDTTPTSLDGEITGCAIIPVHLTSRDNGVVALAATFGSPNFEGDGGLVAVFGAEAPGGPAAPDPCVALSSGGSGPQEIPTLGFWALCLLAGGLGLAGAACRRR